MGKCYGQDNGIYLYLIKPAGGSGSGGGKKPEETACTAPSGIPPPYWASVCFIVWCRPRVQRAGRHYCTQV